MKIHSVNDQSEDLHSASNNNANNRNIESQINMNSEKVFSFLIFIY